MPRRPVRLRRLGTELRQMRTNAGQTRDEVAASTKINSATLFRIEKGQARPQQRTLDTLLAHYGIDDEKQVKLARLAGKSDDQSWHQPYLDELPAEYTDYVEFESDACALREYQSLYLPGLLQTEDYARELIKGLLRMATTEEVEQRVEARMQRQRLLTGENPLRVWAIVDEAAVRRLVGGAAVMRAQLQRLVTEAAAPHVTFQVVPFSAGSHPGMMGSFVHMTFADPEDSDIIYTESMAGDLFLESDADVGRYVGIFDHLRADALSAGETLDLVAKIAEEMQ